MIIKSNLIDDIENESFNLIIK